MMDKSQVDEIKNRTKSAYSEISESSDEEQEEPGKVDDIVNRKMRNWRRRTATEMERLHFQMVNERVVDEITLEFLYKPHTITVLVLLCTYLVYKAFASDDESTENNIYAGIKALSVLFLVVSAMCFPNGSFVRPHPIFWRIIFGVSVLYALLLQFAVYQSYEDLKKMLSWFDPVGLNHTTLSEKEYAINCSDVSIERIWSNMDIFAVGHFLGWAMKALLIRHSIICWYISISWELTEMVFAHLLPNFKECWWDAIFLDVILCNGLGIFVGLKICGILEMRQFHWESIKNIRSTKGRLKRAVMQFMPESWMRVEWLNSFALKRCFAIYVFIMVWLVSELNTFFLKHVFAIDTSHPVVFWRIILIALISAPTIRQYYVYVTDPKIKRIGMQCWLYCAICAMEATICIKFGREQLPAIKLTLISIWILFLALGTVFCVWLSVKWAKYSSKTRSIQVKGEMRECYLDSSCENLGVIGNDVRKRRKQFKVASSSDHTS